MTQSNLGAFYQDRIRGERAENLEEAIRHLEQALQVRTREAFPMEWAMTQSNLGNAYGNRIRGESAQNLEEAIRHYEQALEVRKREAFPEDWAETQNNLAGVYGNRIRGERAQNLEEAIRHYEQALQVWTREAFPMNWAMTQSNLGATYQDRIWGDQAQNLEEAVRHIEQALEVFKREAFPVEWALTQNNLGNAYCNRIRGDHAQNFEEAIRHYEQALEVYTREDFPMDWALTQSNLGNAYWDRIRGERAENLEETIRHYEQALQVWTPRAFPMACHDTAYDLGYLLYDERRFPDARKALETAHKAVEALRGEVMRESAKRDLAEENALLYARLVHCCLIDDDEEAAFEYAAAGKGRTFVDMLATAHFEPTASGTKEPLLAEDLRKARELRKHIANLMAQLTGRSTIFPTLSPKSEQPREQLRANLGALQHEHDRLWEDMSFNYPALTATQRAPMLSADEARNLAAELEATLVEYYQHANGWCAFVVTPKEVYYVPLLQVNDDLLATMTKWLARIESTAGRGKVSYGPLRRLHGVLIAPLRDHLPAGKVVFLAPFSWLNRVPLGAALDPVTEHYVAEDYGIAFAPSLAALRVVVEQARRRGVRAEQLKVESLLNIAYPGPPNSEYYLQNVVPEAEAVARHFPQVEPLYEDKATPNAVLDNASGKDVIHMGCHGWFDPEHPEQSGLWLAEGWLTVQRIIAELRLDRTRLATLSSCLSGRVEVRQGEEHVGLLQGVMYAGARAVITSLWSVNDTATRALFEAFYSWYEAGIPAADALADAAELVRSRRSWKHPYYWAAFQVSGLAHGSSAAESEQLPAEVLQHIEEADHQRVERARGGLAVDTEKMMSDSLILLEQMTENPKDVLRELTPKQRVKVIAALRDMETQGAEAQSRAELMTLADAVTSLVEETPALAALLLPEEMDLEAAQVERRITLEEFGANHPESRYVQEYAPQIRNHIVECRQELERQLQELFPEDQERQ